MPISAIFTPGRAIMGLGNLAYSLGAFLADYNETHVFNKRWPPHARFHNGQTMTLGVLLASTSGFFLLRSTDGSKDAMLDNLFLAATIGSFYCLAGLSAILYPGTDWVDPEFVRADGMTQKPIFIGITAIIWLGYGIEAWRLR